MATLYNTGIEVILAGSISGLLAQFIKLAVYTTRYRLMNFKLIVQTGGMPSSHSASMTGMATSVGLVSGFRSVDFAIALGVALVVMYDAAGLRRAAGRMAGILNRITEDFYKHHPEHLPDRIRELLGHTPFEVFVGGLLGIGLSMFIHDYLRLNGL